VARLSIRSFDVVGEFQITSQLWKTTEFLSKGEDRCGSLAVEALASPVVQSVLEFAVPFGGVGCEVVSHGK
jgi:hypothetical protein